MFTLLVSWLLAACVPGFLILAALGLGRLEKDLAGGTVNATDADDFLAYAEAVDVHNLAREGIPEALEYLHLRQAQRLSGALQAGRHALPTHATPLFAVGLPESGQIGVSVRIHAHSVVNQQVKLTQHVNRV
jgi:hypothetical protein